MKKENITGAMLPLLLVGLTLSFVNAKLWGHLQNSWWFCFSRLWIPGGMLFAAAVVKAFRTIKKPQPSVETEKSGSQN